jgi:hypothetical protein
MEGDGKAMIDAAGLVVGSEGERSSSLLSITGGARGACEVALSRGTARPGLHLSGSRARGRACTASRRSGAWPRAGPSSSRLEGKFYRPVIAAPQARSASERRPSEEARLAWLVRAALVRAPEPASDRPGAAFAPARRGRKRWRTRQRRRERQDRNGSSNVSSRWAQRPRPFPFLLAPNLPPKLELREPRAGPDISDKRQKAKRDNSERQPDRCNSPMRNAT